MMATASAACKFLALIFLLAAPSPSTAGADEALMKGSHSTAPCHPCVCPTRREVNCDGRNLTSVPSSVPNETVTLSLNSNRIRRVTTGMFARFLLLRDLFLAGNEIQVIEEGAFASLRNLQHLDLHRNNLLLDESWLNSSVFAGLEALSVLYLNDNADVDIPWAFPSASFSNLTSLTTLVMDGFRGLTFGPEFAQLQNLKTLKISGNSGKCNLNSLDNDTFENLYYLENLDLRLCKLCHLEALVFKPLKSLQTLDLSQNYQLGFDNIGRAAYGFQWTRIKTLRINSIYPRFNSCVKIKKPQLEYFQYTRLTNIEVNENSIEQFEPGALRLLPRSLTTVSAKLNVFTFGMYIFDLIHLTSLTFVDLSNKGMNSKLPSIHSRDDKSDPPQPWALSTDFAQYAFGEQLKEFGQTLSTLWSDGHDNDLCTQDHFSGHFNGESPLTYVPPKPKVKITYPLPPNISEIRLKWTKLYFHLDEFSLTKNNLTIVDLSCNVFSEWSGPIGGVETVQDLDLSSNFAHYIGVDFFLNFTSLKKLNIQNNMLHKTLASRQSGMIFSRLPTLETLDVSYNRLMHLHENLTYGLHSLQNFVCVGNQLTKEGLNVSIAPAKNLKLLNFSVNALTTIPRELRHSLDVLAEEGKTVSLDISRNPIVCDCWNLEFLFWVRSTKVSLIHLDMTNCTFPGTDMVYPLSKADEAVDTLARSCSLTRAAQITLLAVGVMGFIAVIVGSIAFRFRWRLYYLYYVARNQSRHVEADEEEREDFLFDAFVAFDPDDSSFVQEEMRPRLERDHGLRLCLDYRDLRLGRSSLQGAVEAIHNSRRTVCLLTASFLDSRECRFVFEMARMESVHEDRDVVLFVLKDHVVSRSLPRDILYYIKTESYVEFPRDPRCVDFFWDNLVRALGR